MYLISDHKKSSYKDCLWNKSIVFSFTRSQHLTQIKNNETHLNIIQSDLRMGFKVIIFQDNTSFLRQTHIKKLMFQVVNKYVDLKKSWLFWQCLNLDEGEKCQINEAIIYNKFDKSLSSLLKHT